MASSPPRGALKRPAGTQNLLQTGSYSAFLTHFLVSADDFNRRLRPGFFIRGACPHLDLVGMSATEAVERTAAALRDVLDGRELTEAATLAPYRECTSTAIEFTFPPP